MKDRVILSILGSLALGGLYREVLKAGYKVHILAPIDIRKLLILIVNSFYMSSKNVEWWLKLIIAVLSALVGAIGGGAAVACGAVIV